MHGSHAWMASWAPWMPRRHGPGVSMRPPESGCPDSPTPLRGSCATSARGPTNIQPEHFCLPSPAEAQRFRATPYPCQLFHRRDPFAGHVAERLFALSIWCPHPAQNAFARNAFAWRTVSLSATLFINPPRGTAPLSWSAALRGPLIPPRVQPPWQTQSAPSSPLKSTRGRGHRGAFSFLPRPHCSTPNACAAVPCTHAPPAMPRQLPHLTSPVTHPPPQMSCDPPPKP
jgi:hypothetical protein